MILLRESALNTQLKHIVLSGFLHLYEDLEKIQPNLVKMMLKSKRGTQTSSSSSSSPKTVLHGELWERNILMRMEQE
jgi:hypothetical protein